MHFYCALNNYLGLTNNLNMTESKHSFPQNLPYMQSSSPRSLQPQHPQNMHSQGTEALMNRVHELERNLVELNTMLAQDGGLQEAYAHLQQENEELRRMLEEKDDRKVIAQLEDANQLLKDNLLKQNEEMQELYRQLQEARNSQSRLQERGLSEQLQSKVQELNQEISNLLVKIQELIDQNNEQQESLSQYEGLRNAYDQSRNRQKQLQVQIEILKQQIRSLDEHQMNQIQRIKQEAEEQRNSQRPSLRPGQIKANTERSEQRAELEQLIATLRSEIAVREDELLEQRQKEADLRKKWEKKLTANEEENSILSQQIGRLKAKLREKESRCSQYQLSLQQLTHQRDRQIHNKNDSEALRLSISRLQLEKQQLILRVERLTAQLSQKKFDPQPSPIHKNSAIQLMHQQTEEELDKCKRLNRQLKATAGRYEEDYKDLQEDYQKLMREKLEAERIITANQRQLQRHKAIYEQVVSRCNATAADYRELEKKLVLLEEERMVRMKTSKNNTNYDKQNTQLVQLENSTLRQEVQALKQQLSSRGQMISFHKEGELKRRERQILQQLQMYRQKYLKELEKGKQNQEISNKVADLEEKLIRVNRLLNQKLKQLERYQQREQELLREVDQAYARSKMEFESFGLRHHPQVKKLQNDLLAAQRQLMETQLTFKNQISSIQDELKASRLENQAHRAKIDQLLLEVNKERNSLDYSKLARSLQLSELAQKQLQRQVEHKNALLEELRSQLKQAQARERSKIEASLAQKDPRLQQQKQSLELRIRQLEGHIQEIAQNLNALEPSSRNEDTLRRTINYLSKIKRTAGIQRNYNEDHSRDSFSSKDSENSRYEELSRKKSLIAEQFKLSEQYLFQKTKREETKRVDEGRSREQKGGILRRLQENMAS